MDNYGKVAIESINNISVITGWDKSSQVILLSEFITFLDKDRELEEFLVSKKEIEERM